ncbi:MAG: hypothetical protein RBT63_01705 [Bdellovibrionales bacterium]|jgi:hypothetical protein|nr:hypothetical protein [Bdellovibrionales bacterium]
MKLFKTMETRQATVAAAFANPQATACASVKPSLNPVFVFHRTPLQIRHGSCQLLYTKS